MEPSEHARGPTRTRYLRWVITLLVVGLVVGFASGTLRDGWQQLSTAKVEFSLAWCLVSAVLYVVGLAPMALFWGITLRSLKEQPPALDVARGYYLGHLGKYVPGKALVVVLRTGLLTATGCNVRRVAVSVFIETLTFMATGAALAAALLVTSATSSGTHVLLAAVLAVVVGLPVTPPVARRLARRVLGPPAPLKEGDAAPDGESRQLDGLNWRLTSIGIASSTIAWGMLGLSLWATVRALGVESAAPLSQLGLWVESVTLPYVAGFLSLIPGGLMVRDALLVELLTPQVSPSLALLAATLWRIISLVSEIAICVILQASRLKMAP